MGSKELIKLPKKNGWNLVGSKGSHMKYKHDNKPGSIIVPHPKKDLPTGTVRAIMKQAGIN